MRVFIFLHGAEKKTFLSLKPKREEPIICADSGIKLAMDLPYKPKNLLLIGDLDSVSKQDQAWCKRNNIPIQKYPENKDFTDGELALQYACKKYPKKEGKIILGGVSLLMDHTLGNILSTVPFVKGGHAVSFSLKNQFIYITKDSLKVNNCKDHTISLIPLVKTEIISTSGLEWQLSKENILPYKSRTLRNKARENQVKIEIKEGLIIVIESW